MNLTRLLTAALLATAAMGTAASGTTMSHGHGNLQVMDAWSRELPAVVKNGATYFIVTNAGEQDDRLVGATTPAATRAELHSHEMKDGMMSMRKVEDGLPVPARGALTLAPGGHHLMLMKLTDPLTPGRKFPLTLRFEHAGEVTVEVEVLSMDAAAAKKPEMPAHDSAKHGKAHGSANN